jgi:hypothetical protein
MVGFLVDRVGSFKDGGVDGSMLSRVVGWFDGWMVV